MRKLDSMMDEFEAGYEDQNDHGALRSDAVIAAETMMLVSRTTFTRHPAVVAGLWRRAR